MKAVPIKKQKAWAYFAPDGNIQVRSIAPTRKIARQMICFFESFTWQEYERRGYTVHKIEWSAKPIK